MFQALSSKFSEMCYTRGRPESCPLNLNHQRLLLSQINPNQEQLLNFAP